MFRRNFLSCFIRDRVDIENRRRIGIETICWEMDYPHSDSSWPDAPEQLAEELDGCSDVEIEAISWRNAAKAFDYTAVERLGRKNCTVAALRRKVENRDLSTPKVDVDASEAGRASCHVRRDESPDGDDHGGRTDIVLTRGSTAASRGTRRVADIVLGLVGIAVLLRHFGAASHRASPGS